MRGTRTQKIFLFFVLIILSASFTLRAEAGNAGQTYPIVLTSPENYGSGVTPGSEPQLVWQDVVRHTNASYIAVHFQRFDLAAGDKVVIHDGTGGQQYEMTGKGKMGAGTFWARHVRGDMLVIELYSAGVSGGEGYSVDTYAAGYPIDPAPPPPPTNCGADDKENAICYSASHTNEYAHARPIARLLIGGVTWCTGFLVSTNNHLITNRHCIDTAGDAINTDYEFMSEAPTCGSTNSQGAYLGTIYSGGTAIIINTDLDFALVQVTNGNPVASYGYLSLADEVPTVGEQIYVPQHPDGRAKEIALFSTHASDTGGVCLIQSITEDRCPPANSTSTDVGYFADTEGGSSGSPVISSTSHEVIALHHCGPTLCFIEQNTAIPAHLIKDVIAPYVEEFTVTPRKPVSMGGPVGGPFLPSCRTLSISNNIGTPIPWTASTNSPWLEVHPSTGTLAAGTAISLQVCINANAGSLTLGSHTGIVRIINTNSGDTAARKAYLFAGASDYFTESFLNDLDMDNTMLTFLPITNNPYYSTCRSNSVSSFPVDPAGGTILSLGDDDYINVIFTNGNEAVFYGVAYSNLYVNSNGNITFTGGDTDFDESIPDHFSQPRISLLFRDLSPAIGTISQKQLPDRIAVTFENVSEYDPGNQNSMQAEFFTNGTIRLTFLNIDAHDGIIGLSEGLGVPATFQESDLNTYAICRPYTPDTDNDGMDDSWEWANGLIVGLNDSMHDDDSDGWFNWEEFVADTIPSNNASYFLGITNMTIATNLDLRVFPTSTSRLYAIEWNTNLLLDLWIPYSNSVPGTGGDLEVELTNTIPHINLRSRITLP